MIKELFERFFIIHKCGGCHEILAFEERREALCQSCALAFRVAKTESCPTCLKSVSECSCMPRGLERAGALSLRKLCFYRPEKGGAIQNRLLLSMKRDPNRRVAAFIAGELYSVLRRELSSLEGVFDNSVLVSVPRSVRARRKYGFDQSELVCRKLSDLCGIPYEPLIKRVRRAVEQKTLDRRERFRNVRSLFELNDGYSLKGRYVILYDDAVTTGASMSACVQILIRAGAVGVFCLSMAQVPENSVK